MREFSNEQGWGVLDLVEPPSTEGIWFHWSAIDVDGYKTVDQGRLCEAEVEQAEQDG